MSVTKHDPYTAESSLVDFVRKIERFLVEKTGQIHSETAGVYGSFLSEYSLVQRDAYLFVVYEAVTSGYS